MDLPGLNWFEAVDDETYIIRGPLKYWRYGGKEGQERIDPSDLGFVDPSGGPFITLGYGISGKKVTKIMVDDWEDGTITLKVSD